MLNRHKRVRVAAAAEAAELMQAEPRRERSAARELLESHSSQQAHGKPSLHPAESPSEYARRTLDKVPPKAQIQPGQSACSHISGNQT
jgi:hypothetical protein